MPATLRIKDLRNSITRHPSKRFGKRSLTRINKLIVHHSATTSGSAAAFARYHVNSLGWPGIGYHFVIDKDGTINQTNGLDDVSYHVSGQNTASVGVCCVGHYDQQDPPRAQLDSLVLLLKYLKGTLPGVTIKGHRDYSSKTCPGNLFPLSSVIAAVNRPGSTPNTAPASAPNSGPIPGGAAGAGALLLLPIGAALWWFLK